MKTIGILGGGQLARMLALAGHPLGMRFRVFDPAPEPSAAAVAEHVCAAWDDTAAIERFCEGLDVVTPEQEAVPEVTVRIVRSRTLLAPCARALAVSRDRLAEKEMARSIGIPTVPFRRVDSAAGLALALDHVGSPAVLKTRTLGYDGRGQAVVRNDLEALRAWRANGRVPCVIESYVPFDRELSLVAVRGETGEFRSYPLVENLHRGGVLHRSVAPAPELDPRRRKVAVEAAKRIMDTLDYRGVMTIEFFEQDGRLLFNEIAPRVHNSGHWTIEGAVTSQFENHLRAIAGLPLGATDAQGWSLLCNVLGSAPDAASVLAVPDTHLHLYGKAAREGRKVGHVTTRAATLAELGDRSRELAALFGAHVALHPRSTEPASAAWDRPPEAASEGCPT